MYWNASSFPCDLRREDSSYLRVKCAEMHNGNIQMMYRKILEESLSISQVHADLVRFESAKNRYQKMQKLYPQVILRAPLTYVANYLQMTPETLSRVRASLLFD